MMTTLDERSDKHIRLARQMGGRYEKEDFLQLSATSVNGEPIRHPNDATPDNSPEFFAGWPVRPFPLKIVLAEKDATRGVELGIQYLEDHRLKGLESFINNMRENWDLHRAQRDGQLQAIVDLASK